MNMVTKGQVINAFFLLFFPTTCVFFMSRGPGLYLNASGE